MFSANPLCTRFVCVCVHAYGLWRACPHAGRSMLALPARGSSATWLPMLLIAAATCRSASAFTLSPSVVRQAPAFVRRGSINSRAKPFPLYTPALHKSPRGLRARSDGDWQARSNGWRGAASTRERVHNGRRGRAPAERTGGSKRKRRQHQQQSDTKRRRDSRRVVAIFRSRGQFTIDRNADVVFQRENCRRFRGAGRIFTHVYK